jgi:hypothetical protein
MKCLRLKDEAIVHGRIRHGGGLKMLNTGVGGSWKRLISLRVVALSLVLNAGILIDVAWRDAAASVERTLGGCANALSTLYLAGSFTMPGTTKAQKMNLWIGMTQAADGTVIGVLGDSGQGACEAKCRMIRFERFRKDGAPALLELECEGSRIRTLRMPLHVQWTTSGTIVRLGSSFYGMEQAPFEVKVNNYTVAAK